LAMHGRYHDLAFDDECVVAGGDAGAVHVFQTA
jgi:hypothetical protein